MKNEMWKAIHDVFTKMDLLARNLKLLDIQSKSESKSPDEYSKPELQDIKDAFVKYRSELRAQFDYLRVKLTEYLTERDCYLVLFSIVSYFDELVQTKFLDSNVLEWAPLQRELFDIDKGGVLFFETLDEIMYKPQTPTFILEVYYFCLNMGFRGKYNDNPVKIKEYMKKLQQKIPMETTEQEKLNLIEDEGQLEHIGTPMWYYVAAAGIIVATYFLYYVLANW